MRDYITVGREPTNRGIHNIAESKVTGGWEGGSGARVDIGSRTSAQEETRVQFKVCSFS